MPRSCLIILLLFLTHFAPAAEKRTWKDKTGKTVIAFFIAVDGDNVRLKRTDGRFINVPLSGLSEEDQAWVRKQSAPAGAEAPKDEPAPNKSPADLAKALTGGKEVSVPRPSPSSADPPKNDYSWVEPMKKVHAKFKGTPGTFLQFGDRMTESLDYWTILKNGEGKHKNASREFLQAYELVNKTMDAKCWSDWKSDSYGNRSAGTARWANEEADKILERRNPETALIMFGTNDMVGGKAADHEQEMRSLIQKCLNNGTVVILSTIPPRDGYEDKVLEYVAVQRGLAKEFQLPLIDFHAEIMRRRPNDWNGHRMPNTRIYSESEIDRPIGKDGVLLSKPLKYWSDYGEEALNHHGYFLRSYLTLMKYAEVIEKVLH